MNIAEKLNSIIETKENIKEAIQNKGVIIEDTTPFSEYANKINNISSSLKSVTVDTNASFVTYTGYWTKCLTELPPFTLADNVTSCNYLFAYFSGEHLDLSKLNTSNITNMSNMFTSSYNLKELDLSHFNTDKVTNMGNMFTACQSLTSLDISNFNTSNVTTMGNMFNSCISLPSIDVSSFNTSQVTEMGRMFFDLYKIQSLDISNFNTSNVVSMGDCFYRCSELTTLNMDGLDLSKISSANSIIEGCSKLTNLTFGNNLGKGFTQQQNNYYQLSLSSSTSLTHESLMSVINGLYDLNLTYDVANGGTLYTQSLRLGATNIAKLTDEEILIATNKGWTIS